MEIADLSNNHQSAIKNRQCLQGASRDFLAGFKIDPVRPDLCQRQ